MTHQERILQNGYCIFDLTKNTDADATTPIEFRYTAIMLCVEGEAIIEANMQNYRFVKGDCICMGNVLYKRTMKMSDDFRGRVLVCKSSFAFDTIVGIPTGFLESIYVSPIINIADEKEWALINNHFDNLSLMQDKHLGVRHLELVALTFRAVVLLMASFRGTANLEQAYYNHGDVYYRNFIELIDEHVKQEHDVAFYAERLHITAKYLNELCKQKSDHKAKEIISSFLISKIKQEIIMSGKSIKTIAYEYGFSDQSSMGKFFTKITGQSPSEFRKGYKIPQNLEG
ncbi:MAG: helix-turn-helix domain-containing protein [Muribaculaceae bacterium]|nr:helix-turn-helix domain-containing protein [Muribaculaceae bacterium]